MRGLLGPWHRSPEGSTCLGLFLPARDGGETTGTAEKRRWTWAGGLPGRGFPRPREYMSKGASGTPGPPARDPWGEEQSRGGWQWQDWGACTWGMTACKGKERAAQSYRGCL